MGELKRHFEDNFALAINKRDFSTPAAKSVHQITCTNKFQTLVFKSKHLNLSIRSKFFCYKQVPDAIYQWINLEGRNSQIMICSFVSINTIVYFLKLQHFIPIKFLTGSLHKACTDASSVRE